jgi:site-specific recombinase XerD
MGALKLVRELAPVIDCEQAITEYIKTLDVKPKSKETYTKALRVFFNWSNGTIPTNRAEILAYKQHLADNYKASTINAYITAIKGFYSFLEAEGLCPNVTANIKGVKNSKGFKKDALTINQAKALLNNDKDTLEAKRNTAIITLMIHTGLRTVEIERANIEDIRQTAGETLLYIQGKGRDTKDEFVILTSDVISALNEYLTLKGKCNPSDPLFSATSNRNQNGRLTTRSISRIVKGAMLEAGIDSDRITAHSLRHTAVTLSLLGGATIQEAQQLARHSNINTTLIYAHNISRIKNAAERNIADILRQ